MDDQTPRTERWLDSLHEDANGLVWVTKAELRQAARAIEAQARTEALDVEVLESAMWNLDGGGGRRADDDYYTRYAERLIESYRAILAARKAVR